MNIKFITLILLIIGGVNWGLVGLLNLNLVSALFGESVITTVVYALVGLSAVYTAATSLGKA